MGGERGHHQGELQKEGEEGYVECILAWWCITIVLYNMNIAYVSTNPTPTYPTLGLIILIGVNIITSSCVTFLQYE